MIQSMIPDRLHALDAVRAFALLLGVAFHAGFSFMPGTPARPVGDRRTPRRARAIGVLLFVVAHLPDVAVLLHRGLLRADAVSTAAARAASGAIRLEAHPGAAGRRLAGALPGHRGGLDLGADEDLRRHAAARARGPAAPPPLGAFPLTHLWFLYYLLVLYVGVVLGPRRRARDRPRAAVCAAPPTRCAWSRAAAAPAAVALALPLTVALYRRARLGRSGSASRRPTSRSSRRSPARRLTAPRWPSAGSCTGSADLLEVVGAAVAGPPRVRARSRPPSACAIAGPSPAFVPRRPGCRTLATPSATASPSGAGASALLGLALRFLSQRERRGPLRRRRLLLDLPRAPAGRRRAAGRGRAPAAGTGASSFPLILVVSLAVLFLSYHYLVRSTFIGQVLNGRKRTRGAWTAAD